MDFEAIRKLFKERDRFAAQNGIELLEVGDGRAVARMQVAERHLNGHDIVHGGAVFTLADYAFAAASNSHGVIAVSISVSINYIKATRVGDVLTATAVETARNPKLGYYTVTITDAAGTAVAVFQGMTYFKKDTVDAMARA